MKIKNDQAAPRPNLLILICDQQRAIMHFPDDWEQEHMPALSLLKRHGVEFENGMCNTCMCSPSRSTLFTSLYPAQHGVTDTLSFGGKYSITEPVLDASLPNLAKMLRPYYDVQYRGKWHLNKGGMNNLHPEKSLMSAEVAQFGFQGWIAPDAGEDIALPNFGAGYAAHDALYVQQALDYVRAWKRRKKAGLEQRPFALVVSLVNPHDVLSYPRTYVDGGYDDKWLQGDIQVPDTIGENLLENWKPAAQWQLKAVMAASLGAIDTPELARSYINFYGNLMSYVDHQLAELMGEFYKRDAEGNFGKAKKLGKETLILRIADHGEMGLAHGGLRQKAFNAYEETLRVPYIYSNPELINSTGQPKKTRQLAGLIDVVPTLAGLLNINIDGEGFKGANLAPAVLEPDGEHALPSSHLFTFDDVKAGNKSAASSVAAANRLRCVRTHDWKYVRYFDADGSYLEEYELYYIKGIHDFAKHPGDDPRDALGMALKGFAYEHVNLAYAENPLVAAMPEAARQQIEAGRLAMEALLKEREKDMLTGKELAIRRQLGKLPAPGPIN